MNDDLTPEQEGARLKELLGNRNKAPIRQGRQDSWWSVNALATPKWAQANKSHSGDGLCTGTRKIGAEFSPRLAKAIAEANRATTANTPSGGNCGQAAARHPPHTKLRLTQANPIS